MANANISDFRTMVGYYVKDITNETTVTDAAIVSTLQDFCRWTHLWKENHSDISIVADTARYSLTPPTTYGDATQIAGLDEVKHKQDGDDDDQYRPLELTSREYLDKYDKNWEYRESTIPDKAFFDVLTDELVLVDIPTVASTDGILVRLILMPDRSATTCPQFFLQYYENAIAYGTAGRLMRMTNKRWSNPKLGDYFHNLYLSERMNAQKDHDLGMTDRDYYTARPHKGFTGGARAEQWTF